MEAYKRTPDPIPAGPQHHKSSFKWIVIILLLFIALSAFALLTKATTILNWMLSKIPS